MSAFRCCVTASLAAFLPASRQSSLAPGRLSPTMPELSVMPPRKLAKTGFHENRLIACVREKENELNRKRAPRVKGKRSANLDLKLDRWFLTRFSLEHAYAALRDEFEHLDGGSNAWAASAKSNMFINTPQGGGTDRQLRINAQRIGPINGCEYVACEGPTRQSVFDFWALIWQEKIDRVLSVNFPYEERLYPTAYDKTRETIQYWPVVPGETLTFMPFKITCIASKMKASTTAQALSCDDMVYRVTRMLVQYCNPILGPVPPREVTHVCYYRWPDGRVPIPWPRTGTHAHAGMQLVDLLNKELVGSSPLLVHCHAGLGRTGVVIAADAALRQMRDGTVNIKSMVEQVRERRARAVMNHWQYAYIHLLVAEKALSLGVLSSSVGGHSSRQLIDSMWRSVLADIDLLFGGEILTYDPALL